MKVIKILILEDDIETLSVIFGVLKQLEEKAEFQPVVLNNYKQVETMINDSDEQFDLILLDRDCGLAGSFHVLNIEKFGADKIISISSVPEYNEHAKKRGVTKIIHKEYSNLKKFEDKLLEEINSFLDPL